MIHLSPVADFCSLLHVAVPSPEVMDDIAAHVALEGTTSDAHVVLLARAAERVQGWMAERGCWS